MFNISSSAEATKFRAGTKFLLRPPVARVQTPPTLNPTHLALNARLYTSRLPPGANMLRRLGAALGPSFEEGHGAACVGWVVTTALPSPGVVAVEVPNRKEDASCPAAFPSLMSTPDTVPRLSRNA